MYENLMVEPFLFHWGFVALNFGIWHRLVGLEKINKAGDFLLPIVMLGGPIAFFLIFFGVLIRWFVVKTGIQETRIAADGKKTYWLYQVQFPFEMYPGAVTWMGFWVGLSAMLIAYCG